MYYKLSESKRKFRIGILVFVYLLGLVPITYSVLEVVYDKALFMPTWLIVVLTILGQVLPLGYYILHLVERDEVEDDKSRFIYSLFFAASVINRSLSSTSPYRYITLYGYSPVKSWLRFLASPLIFIAVATLSWIYVLIRDKKKKSR
uniref:hypothetical protein n=1 Tax=Ezakiella massiliensis TaxID=1852374 RepID=UPI00094EBC15|nr:hypothetical protein [Ezakiella massiliensis]